MHQSALQKLVARKVGADRASQLFERVIVEPRLLNETASISRAGFSAALNFVLFDDLLARVPTGAAYVADQAAKGIPITFDHSALRTIRFDGPTGALPAGET